LSSEIKYHKGLAAGRWFELSLAEQFGNIGSEVHRTINWFLEKDERFNNAFDRTLELFDLTISDKRCEYFCTLLFETEYSPELERELHSFDKYFMEFAIYARKDR